jgi:outer membrane receptor protein involved in Fe transport
MKKLIILGSTFLCFVSYGNAQKTNIDTSNRIKKDTSKFGSAVLKEVQVVAKKNMLNTSIDRKVYNPAQDIMAQSGSASDILRNVPSVEVDIDGNVSLRGSGDMQILINGRPSPLMGVNRAQALQQIPANTIERIEVITNPSAKYRPDGTAGMINIVLKRNTKAGFGGNITGNVGNKERANGSANLNFKSGNWNVFASYSLRQDERNRFGHTERTFYDSSTGKVTGTYQDFYRSKARPIAPFVRAGFEYTINKMNTIGISGNLLSTRLTRRDTTQRFFYDSSGEISSRINRERLAPAVEHENDATFFWEHRYDKEGKEFRAEFTTSTQSEDESNFYTNRYLFPKSSIVPDNNFVRQHENNQQLTADWVNPVSEKIALNYGYAGSFVQQEIAFITQNYDSAAGTVITNPKTTNTFRLNQQVHALYATWSKENDKWGVMIGLRGEQSFVRSTLVTKDSAINNNYFMLFPTIHLSYKLNKGEIKVNYSKRVNRPDGDNLNPFPEYMDNLNLRAGNPKLLPEIVHSLELGYQWKSKSLTLVPSIYYRNKTNGFTTITQKLNDSVFLTTQQNLSNDQSAGFELVASYKWATWFIANLSNNIFYNRINFGTVAVPMQKSIFAMSTNLNLSFNITPTTMWQVTCIYRSARQTIQGYFYPTFVSNMGIRKEMLQGKMSVIATLSDVFGSFKQRSWLQSPFLYQQTLNYRDTQVFYVGFNYRFGKSIKKTEEKMQYDNSL